jgi:hypothetical protein
MIFFSASTDLWIFRLRLSVPCRADEELWEKISWEGFSLLTYLSLSLSFIFPSFLLFAFFSPLSLSLFLCQTHSLSFSLTLSLSLSLSFSLSHSLSYYLSLFFLSLFLQFVPLTSLSLYFTPTLSLSLFLSFYYLSPLSSSITISLFLSASLIHLTLLSLCLSPPHSLSLSLTLSLLLSLFLSKFKLSFILEFVQTHLSLGPESMPVVDKYKQQ